MWDWGEFKLRVNVFFILRLIFCQSKYPIKKLFKILRFWTLGPLGGGNMVRVKVKFCGIGRSLS